jgi:IclR family KDG regulon transcriptional repressor
MRSSQAPHESNLIQTVLKALDVMECLASTDRPLSTLEVAQLCGLSRPTAYRFLTTLLTRGYVASVEDGHYQLGTRILTLSEGLLDRLDLTKLARSELRELSQASNETVHFAILDDTEMLYIDKVESSQPVRMHSTIGTRNPLHCTAIGKAVLAFIPVEERNALLDRITFIPRTPNTITDRAALVEHLELVYTRGFAIDDIENEEGIRCVGAPVFNHTRRVFAAISISGPAYRLSIPRLLELSTLVITAADAISRKLGYVPQSPSLGDEKLSSLEN